MERILAKSKAGHDKNHVYVVLGEEADCVLLSNGRTKTCTSPKRKKKIHIQPIKNLLPEIREMLQAEEITDREIVKILELYNRRKEDV